MAKNFTKILCAFLAFVMCLGTVPAFAIESTPELTAEEKAAKWPIDKTANGLDENDQTDVTLTVPGIVEGYIDVVFILGGQMQENKETVNSAIKVFKPAMESGKATVRVGIIALERGQEIIVDLNSDEAVLNPDTYEEFLTEKFVYMSKLPGGSTNLHSQLIEAQKMLDKEDKAAPENKYLFVVATGRTYWFDNENGDQATIITTETAGQYAYGNYVWQSQRAVGTSYYQIPTKYNNDYSKYFEQIVKWVENDINNLGDPYAYAPDLDPDDIYSYSNWYTANKTECYVGGGTTGSRVGLHIKNPAPQAEGFKTGVVAGVPHKASSKGGPDHALNYERAQYECVQVWKELVAEKYNCYAICSEAYKYQNNNSYINGIQVGHAFMDYLSKLAGKGDAVVVYENNGTAVGKLKENFFASALDDSLYTTSIGTTVVDYIGIDDDGNFEFIQDAKTIKLVVGGKTYLTKEIAPRLSDTWEVADFSVAFYAPDDSQDGWADDPTFWLDYYYRSGKEDEQFVWEFGENVSMENLATLTYKLQLTGKQEEAGEYIVPTNISATLYPIYSNGKEGEPQVFPVPRVTYSVVPYDVDIVLALGAGIAQYDADHAKGYTHTYDSIVSLVEPLVNQGINVKLGLIAVEHYDDVAMPLTVLTKDNYKTVITDGLNAIQQMPAGPTNLHGNIVAAKEMLDADTSVPAANKFFYVFATGRTYNYDNAEGVPTTIINKLSFKGNTYYYWGHYLWQSQRGGHTSLYMIPAKYNNDFSAYWADVEKWVAADGDTYAYSFTEAYDPSNPQWFNTFYAANTNDAKSIGASSRFGWILKDLTNSGLAGIGSGSNPKNALNYERAQYEAYQTYQAMIKAGYNCEAICTETPNYQNGSEYIKNGAKYTGTSTIQLGHSFMNFLNGGEAKVLFDYTRDENGNFVSAATVFAITDYFEGMSIDTTKLVKSTTKALEFNGITYDIKVSHGTIAYITVEAEGDVKYEWHIKTSGGEEYVSEFDTDTYKVVMDSTYDEQEVYCIITDELGNKKTTDTVTLILSH